MSGGKDWTEDEDSILINEYSGTCNYLLSKKLDRTISGICHRASRLGLKKSEEYRKEHINDVNSKRMKRDNPSFGGLSEKHKLKIGSASKIAHKEKPRTSTYFKKGDENVSKRKDIRIKHKKDALKQWANKKSRDKLLKGLKSIPNKPEIKMINLLKKNNIPFDYVGDGKIWFKGYGHTFNPDFISKSKKRIIEVFGDYWHNLPKNIEKDKKRLKAYSKSGYSTLIIWEHELKDTYAIIFKIKKFMKNET